MGEWRHECEWESEFADKGDKDSVTNFMFLSTDIGVGVKARVDMSKIVDSGLHSFLFSLFYLIFLFLLFSIFYF